MDHLDMGALTISRFSNLSNLQPAFVLFLGKKKEKSPYSTEKDKGPKKIRTFVQALPKRNYNSIRVL
ncbi:hypothetical protein NC652_036587 [Populus alba x Populus x berolinensis]|nr:hypothetical protein NC652_036587 [Populus alba x Populus x berolinensis]